MTRAGLGIGRLQGVFARAGMRGVGGRIRVRAHHAGMRHAFLPPRTSVFLARRNLKACSYPDTLLAIASS